MNLSQLKEFSKNNPHFKKHATWASTTLVILFCFGYWLHNRNYVSTDDAYVNANVIQVSPQVTGKIKTLYVQNNQYVHQGQPLFDIDSTSAEMLVERNQAQLDLARLNVEQETAAVAAAQADVAMHQAELQNAKLTADRIRSLLKKHYVSQQNDDDTQAKLKKAEAALDLSRANLEAATKKLGTPGESNEQIRQAQASLAQAKLDLAYTHVTAATQGYITNMSLRIGDVVQANQPLFALISDKEFWVDANFKETDLENIKPGQKTIIHVDMYSNHKFTGIVNSVSSGSGAAFSLMPPENATGNWVKVTQRVPVKIMITNADPKFPLHIGTTASAKIKIG